MCFGCNQDIPPPRFAGHVLILPNDYSLDAASRVDLSGDHRVTSMDAFLVINALNRNPGVTLFSQPDLRQSIPRIDVNGDGDLTAADALAVIDYLNTHSPFAPSSNGDSAAEGESASNTTDDDISPMAADAIYGELVTSRRGRIAS